MVHFLGKYQGQKLLFCTWGNKSLPPKIKNSKRAFSKTAQFVRQNKTTRSSQGKLKLSDFISTLITLSQKLPHVEISDEKKFFFVYLKYINKRRK